MKKRNILILAVLFTACTKDYSCCTTKVIDDAPAEYDFLNGTTEHCVDFRGTKEEKEAFEADGSEDRPQTYPAPYTIQLETVCVPD